MTLDLKSTSEIETTQVELTGSDWRLNMTVSLPRGPMQLKEMLPLVRNLGDAVVGATTQSVQQNGQKISCRKGCGACCRQLVAISLVEAEALAALIEEMPPERKEILRSRFAEAIRRLEEAGLLNRHEPKGERVPAVGDLGSREANLSEISRCYFRLQIPCPFLEDESCSIHEARPLICREYHVTSPAERCAQLFDQPVDRVKPMFSVADALTRTTGKILGAPAYTIPLVLALEWSEVHAGWLAQRQSGTAMFEALLNEIVESAR